MTNCIPPTELGRLTIANLMEKVKGLLNLAYQLGLEEWKNLPETHTHEQHTQERHPHSPLIWSRLSIRTLPLDGVASLMANLCLNSQGTSQVFGDSNSTHLYFTQQTPLSKIQCISNSIFLNIFVMNKTSIDSKWSITQQNDPFRTLSFKDNS